MRPPVLVLGMHRSGTSAVAGALVRAGWTVPGTAIRNWDNPRGHFESTALIRLNEEVLAASGGHWLAAPPEGTVPPPPSLHRPTPFKADAGWSQNGYG